MQMVAAGTLMKPAEHAWHVSELKAPTAVENVPLEHMEQVADPLPLA